MVCVAQNFIPSVTGDIATRLQIKVLVWFQVITAFLWLVSLLHLCVPFRRPHKIHQPTGGDLPWIWDLLGVTWKQKRADKIVEVRRKKEKKTRILQAWCRGRRHAWLLNGTVAVPSISSISYSGLSGNGVLLATCSTRLRYDASLTILPTVPKVHTLTGNGLSSLLLNGEHPKHLWLTVSCTLVINVRRIEWSKNWTWNLPNRACFHTQVSQVSFLL